MHVSLSVIRTAGEAARDKNLEAKSFVPYF